MMYCACTLVSRDAPLTFILWRDLACSKATTVASKMYLAEFLITEILLLTDIICDTPVIFLRENVGRA